MTALAESRYASVRTRSPSSRGSIAASLAERQLDRSLIELKHFRADYSECLNGIEDIRNDTTLTQNPMALTDASYRLGKHFISALPSTARAPEVTIDAEGELVFDWQGPSGQWLSVCAQSNGKLAYAIRYSANRATHGYTVMDQAVPREIMDAINALRR